MLEIGLIQFNRIVRKINPFKATNLTFEGGGAAGIGYVGALRVLEEEKILPQIQRVAGTSAGAITAYLLAIGCTSEEMKRYLSQQSLQDLVHKKWYNPYSWNLFREYGVYEKDRIVKWLENITEEKLGPDYRRITFKQLQALRQQKLAANPEDNTYKEVFICVTNLSTQHLDIFSHRSARYQDTAIVDAVGLGSDAIPLYFKAWKYLEQLFVDGGVIANDPQIVFDERAINETGAETYRFNEKTLAFRLDTRAEVANMFHPHEQEEKATIAAGGFFSTKIDGLASFVKALVNALQHAQSLLFQYSYQRYRTVLISRGVTIEGKTKDISATDFDMPESAKQQLIDNGYAATKAHLEAARKALQQPLLQPAVVDENVLQPSLSEIHGKEILPGYQLPGNRVSHFSEPAANEANEAARTAAPRATAI